jgi:transposase
MKFVSPLNEATRKALRAILHDDILPQRRARAHAVLLSAQGYRLEQLAEIFDRDRDTVSVWLTNWEEHAFDGLQDAPKSGRPRKTSLKQDKQILRIVEQHPQQARAAQAKLKKKNGLSLSVRTVQRRLKEAGYVFKRIALRPAKRPEAQEYARAKKRLRILRQRDKRGEIVLYSSDAAGFTLGAIQPCAWQHPTKPLWIAKHGDRRRLNVMGFFNKNLPFHCMVFEQTMDSRCVIAAIDDLLKHRTGTTPIVLTLDNASIHHSDEMLEAQEQWRREGLTIEFLPPYSPELNPIEIVWKNIKYQWLPLKAFYSFASLRRELYLVLNGVGTKYLISFVK